MTTINISSIALGYQMYKDSTRAVYSESAATVMCNVDYVGTKCILVHNQISGTFSLREDTGNLYSRILWDTDKHEKYIVIKDL